MPAARTQSKPPRRTQEERRAEAERRLMAAAVKIVAEQGLERFTLAEIGQAAGYSRSLAAHYFGSKEGLEAALAERIVRGFALAVTRTEKRQPGLPRLLRVVGYYFESAAEDPVGARALMVVLNAALTSKALKRSIRAINRRSARAFETDIRAGIAAGEIARSVDPRARAELILATLRGAVSQWLIDRDNVDLRALRNEYIASLKRSLAR